MLVVMRQMNARTPNLGQGIRWERIIFRSLQMGENGLR
jgi:hypothetical protein